MAHLHDSAIIWFSNKNLRFSNEFCRYIQPNVTGTKGIYVAYPCALMIQGSFVLGGMGANRGNLNCRRIDQLINEKEKKRK